MQEKFDVLGIGNAIIDVLTQVSDEYLNDNGYDKGIMRLITEQESDNLYETIGTNKKISGGSAANTMAGIASLGANSAYIGVVRDDDLGQDFHQDLTAQNVHCATLIRSSGPATARAIILITPDGERTMNAFLGICTDLKPDDIDTDLIAKTDIVYLEGYLFDPPSAKQAFHKAADIARKAGKKIAITLSDPFCVDRHRTEFLDFVKNKADILFANEAEIKSLYETDNFETIVDKIRSDMQLTVITRNDKGSVVVMQEEIYEIPAKTVKNIVDATGAGDLYAAGFLCGYTKNLPVKSCAMLGNICAADIISQIGARPQVALKKIAQENGFNL